MKDTIVLSTVIVCVLVRDTVPLTPPSVVVCVTVLALAVTVLLTVVVKLLPAGAVGVIVIVALLDTVVVEIGATFRFAPPVSARAV